MRKASEAEMHSTTNASNLRFIYQETNPRPNALPQSIVNILDRAKAKHRRRGKGKNDIEGLIAEAMHNP